MKQIPHRPVKPLIKLFFALLLPASIAVSLGAFAWARETGGNTELALLVSSVLTLALALLLERSHPFRADWNQAQEDRLTDWLSFGVLAGMVQPILKAVSPLLVIAVYGQVNATSFFWPNDMPFIAQVLLVTLLAELGKYASHRWHHTQPALWWLHAMHHSSERLYTVNGFRFHPLNYAINHVASILPLMLLGVPADVLLAYTALTQPVLMLQHANLPLTHGWLNHVFSTNELHRWHHSTQWREGHRNFGSALVIWDQVFGTYYNPKAEPHAIQPHPEKIGLFGSDGRRTPYPARASYLHQLRAMFTPGCCFA